MSFPAASCSQHRIFPFSSTVSSSAEDADEPSAEDADEPSAEDADAPSVEDADAPSAEDAEHLDEESKGGEKNDDDDDIPVFDSPLIAFDAPLPVSNRLFLPRNENGSRQYFASPALPGSSSSSARTSRGKGNNRDDDDDDDKENCVVENGDGGGGSFGDGGNDSQLEKGSPLSGKSGLAIRRIVLANSNENSPRTPFRNCARKIDGYHVDLKMMTPPSPKPGANIVEESSLSNIEYQILEKQMEKLEEQRDEGTSRLKDVVNNYEVLQNRHSQVTRKHDMETAALKNNFESQLSAKTAVISTLQGVITDQYSEIERLQNDLIEAQSKISSSNDDSSSNSASNSASSVSKLVSDLRLERRSLHEEKIKLVTALKTTEAENSSMRYRLDSLTMQVTSPKIAMIMPTTPDMQNKLLAEVQCQARDLRAKERIHKKEIDKLKSELADLKKERRCLKAANVELSSSTHVLGGRLKKAEEEKNKFMTKVLTLEVDLDMSNKAISKSSKLYRTEMSELLAKNLEATKYLRDSQAETSMLKTQLAHLEIECEKNGEQTRESQALIEKYEKEIEKLNSKSFEKKDSDQDRGARAEEKEARQKWISEKEEFESRIETFRSRTLATQSQLNSITELYEGVCVDKQRLQLQINELESEAITNEKLLKNSCIQAEQAVHNAISQTEAKNSSEIERLNNLVTKLCAALSELRNIKQLYVNFKKETAGLPAWYRKVFYNFSTQVRESIKSTSDHNEEMTRRYLNEMTARKDLHNQIVDMKGQIRVICRVRPTQSASATSSATSSSGQVITFDEMDNAVLYVHHGGHSKSYTFDRVFLPSTSQGEVFDEVSPLVTSVVDGYNLCIFAYGQTGSGKTYTMEGPQDSPGINQRALSLLFRITEERGAAGWNFEILISILEIYNENFYDLLSSTPSEKLTTTSGLNGVQTTSLPVTNVDDINDVLERGRRNRVVAATKLNQESSRSHALVCINVQGRNRVTNEETTGKLNLCDLAGSENVGHSGAEGARLCEAKSINKSICALGKVIHALRSKQTHVPYRDSKLTTHLKNSLSGNSKVLMVVQVAPEERHVRSTQESLKFGERASKVETNSSQTGANGGTPLQKKHLTPQPLKNANPLKTNAKAERRT